MRGIIYYNSDFINANEKLKTIVNQYNQAQIPVIKCHYRKIGSYAEFANGDTWRVVGASDNARGYKWNIAYIERSIDYDIYQCIISPSAVNCPFSAIHLWGEGDLHLTNEPPTPF